MLRILYAEDVPEDAELCVRALQKAGYQITADVVGTKEEFTGRLDSGSYDVVLSDYRMPGWSGMEALEILKRSAKDIPFILVSGEIGEEAAVECLKLGATDYILKDRPGRLPAAIRSALEEKAAREERARAETRIRYLNRVYAVLTDVNQTIVRVREPQALFTETCRIAVEKGGFRMAWVGLLDAVDDSVRPVAYAGVTNGYLDKPPIVSGDGPGARPATIVLREGRRAVCNDIKHDPGAAAWRDDALARGYRSAAAFPLTAKGKTIGTFTLYASEPEFFDTEELVLLDEMASDLAFAMELNQSEERQLLLSTAIEQAPASVVITDTEGRIEYVNPAFTEITGFTPEEVLGKNPRLLKSGQHDRPFYQNLWNTIVAGKSWHGEIVNRRKDGSLYMEDGSITPVRSGDGQIVRFVSIRQDVTARHQMEQDLRESEERYRLVVEHIHDALITDDLAGKITFAKSTFFCKLYGLRLERELIGRTPICPAGGCRKDAQAGAQSAEKGTIPPYAVGKPHYPFERRRGQVWGLRGTGRNAVVGLLPASDRTYALGMVADISERKRAEKPCPKPYASRNDIRHIAGRHHHLQGFR